jgi:hypothetical protein
MAQKSRFIRSPIRVAGVVAALTGALVLTLSNGQPASALTAIRTTSIHTTTGLTGVVLHISHASEVAADKAQPAPAVAPPVAVPAPPAPVRTVVHRVAPARAPSAPASYRNRLISADGSLNTGVGYYGDCSGRTPLTHSMAAIDGCVGGRTYFVGHNPGVFTPLMHFGVGALITWYDGAGNAHRLRIIAVRQWNHSAGAPPLVSGATTEFQTCITADGSLERILDAAPA